MKPVLRKMKKEFLTSLITLIFFGSAIFCNNIFLIENTFQFCYHIVTIKVVLFLNYLPLPLPRYNFKQIFLKLTTKVYFRSIQTSAFFFFFSNFENVFFYFSFTLSNTQSKIVYQNFTLHESTYTQCSSCNHVNIFLRSCT